MGIFFILGVIFALFSPEEYTSNASVIPEYELQDKVNEVIESYGLLFGMTESTRENRTPSYLLELYPHMINSVAFQQELMHKPFDSSGQDTTLTMFQYFTGIHRPSFFHTLYNYTLGLPGTLLSASKSKPVPAESLKAAPEDSSERANRTDIPILSFSPDERKVLNELSGRITATFERRTGIVRVSATMPESDLAAKLVKLTLETLHEKAGSYKTGKARIYQDFLKVQQSKSEEELEKARRELIEFNNADGQQLNKRMELQSSYEVHLDHYNTLTQQLNRIELNIQEQIPAFRLLDDITLPSEQIQPKRNLIIFLSLVLGFFVAVAWITVSFILAKNEWSLSS